MRLSRTAKMTEEFLRHIASAFLGRWPAFRAIHGHFSARLGGDAWLITSVSRRLHQLGTSVAADGPGRSRRTAADRPREVILEAARATSNYSGSLLYLA